MDVVPKVKPFIDKHNCQGINIPSDKDNWKNKKKDKFLILHILIFEIFILILKKNLSYVSKHRPEHEKQIIILMILSEVE